jgi:thiosulfate dehydrogenase [quinone] large subunit
MMDYFKKLTLEHWLIGILRIVVGWIFLWTFLDKTFGLGWDTDSDAAYLKGNSVTEGFLVFGTNPDGPLADLFQKTLGEDLVDLVDIVYLLMLLVVGVGLILGTWTRIAGVSGAIFMISIWISYLPPDVDAGFLSHNILGFDEHIVYFFVLLFLAISASGRYIGLGEWWESLPFWDNLPPLAKEVLI